MSTDRITAAAAMLLAVRQGGPRLANLGANAPTSEAEAWAVQQAVLAGLDDSIGGYKCSAPPGKAPSAAIMAAGGFRRSPARWSVPAGEKIGIETEIAFRFGQDLPGRATPYSLADVLDAVAGVFPIVEMVSTRFQNHQAVTPLEAMADNGAHGGFIMGADVPGWRELDLKGLTMRQSCGGAVQVEQVGGNPSGDPLVPLLWLANHLPSMGLPLRAGQVVTTGSCSGLLWVEPNQRVIGEFLGFGQVIVDLA